MKKSKLLISLALIPGIVLLTLGKTFAQTEEPTAKDETAVKSTENVEYFRGGIKIEKKGDDTTVVYINNNPWHGMNHGKHCFFGCRDKFNGHWAGVELGWNGYVTKDFDFQYPANENYLELNLARSLMVNLNPFELNFNLAKNHLGIVSGLGFSMQNYYFQHSTFLTGDSSTLRGYTVYDANGVEADIKTNKLYTGWLTVPVFLEYQTRSGVHANSFHISAGIIGAVKLCSYTKQKYYSRNQNYYLRDANGNDVGSIWVGEEKIKNKDQFYLNPFRADASIRIGWSFINLWGTYTFTGMFQKNKGPEVYPYTVGITLLGW